VHTFWNRNVQRDANAAAHEWLMANDELPSVDMQGPFDVIPAAGSQVAFIPGSTLDLQRQRQAADVAANTRRWADYEASQAATPTPVPGVQDIEPDVEQYTSQPAQTQWEVYDRSTDRPVFRMYAADQAEAWRKGQEWVANYARMTPDQPIYGIDYSVRQSTAPVTESSIQYNELNQDNKNLIIDRARDKADGIYSFRGIMFRVRNGKVTHWAVDGKILQAMGHFNTQVGSYEPGRSSQAKVMLKSIKEGVTESISVLEQRLRRELAEGQETYLSPNMKAVPNTDPTSPEDHDYYYKDQQIKPGDPFHSKIKDLHLRQLDPAYDAFRNAFDNPIKPGPAVPEQPPQGDTIVPSRPVPPAKIKGPDGKPLKLKDIIQLDPPLSENFADGRHPEDKGDSKRLGVPTKSSVSNLRKFAKTHSGRAAQLAHWMANMKSGKRKTNETVIGNLHFPQLTIAVDDHSIDRTRTRGIDPHTIDLSLRKLNAVADQLSQIEPNAQVWAYDTENNLGLGLRRISSRDMLFKLKTVVAARPFDGAIPIIELS